MSLCTILYGIYSRTSAQLSRCPMTTAIIATPLTKSNVRFLFAFSISHSFLKHLSKLKLLSLSLFLNSNYKIWFHMQILMKEKFINQFFCKNLYIVCFTLNLIIFIQCGITEGKQSNRKTYKRFNKDTRRQHK